MERTSSAVVAACILALPASVLAANEAVQSTTETETQDDTWSSYGGDAGGARFAPFAQITRDNVTQLKQVWTYRTGELGQKFARADKLSFEATPIFVNDTLYLSTPTNIVIALDPATGRERW